jgi:hypothetical protein
MEDRQKTWFLGGKGKPDVFASKLMICNSFLSCAKTTVSSFTPVGNKDKLTCHLQLVFSYAACLRKPSYVITHISNNMFAMPFPYHLSSTMAHLFPEKQTPISTQQKE